MQRLRKLWFSAGLAASVAVLTTSMAESAEKQDIVKTAVSAGSFETLATALDAAELIGALKGKGPFTVFAPSDDAFAKLPKGTVNNLLKPENKASLVNILTYHVVPGRVSAKQVVELPAAATLNGQRVDIEVTGGKVQVDGAQVVATDIECSNGVIHVIDRVLLPNSDNIVAAARKAKSFDTLLAAVKAAGLDKVLAGEGPFTVFAPTDEAFARLPDGTVESLLKPENRGKLIGILKYHVVAGRVFSDAAVSAGSVKTLQGDAVKIKADKSGAKINQANLIKVDVDASNGVIHVIDQVLIPVTKRKVGAAAAKRVIESAVAEGTKLYNRGHHAACARVYQQAARQLIQQGGNQMPPLAMTSLSSALEKTRHSQCTRTNAWTLRRGLDTAYHHLNVAARR